MSLDLNQEELLKKATPLLENMDRERLLIIYAKISNLLAKKGKTNATFESTEKL